MTRINVGIKVSTLTDQHLLAEHREIKRTPYRFSVRLKKKDFSGIPEKFKLGGGHELFFADKGAYTLKRYREIHEECKRRGFDVTDFSSSWDVYEGHGQYFNDWEPTIHAKKIISERIIERIKGQEDPCRYESIKITKIDAIVKIKSNFVSDGNE